MAKFLIDNGADVSALNKERAGALTGTIENGYIEIVKVLVKHVANIHEDFGYGVTALHIASGTGHLNIVLYLVEMVLILMP